MRSIYILFFLVGTLCLTSLSITVNAQQELTPIETYIHTIVKQVQEEGHMIDQLTEGDLISLPVGLARQIGGVTYVVAIDSAYSNDNGWYFSAYASIQLPGTNRPLAFMAKDIRFHKKGIAEDFKLGLVSAPSIPLGDYITLEFPTSFKSNYVVFGCDGFKSANLQGDFVFSNELLVPDPELSPNKDKVVSSFVINTSDLNDILLAVSITPFQLKDLKDVTFEVSKATFDMSDRNNPAGLKFPKDYHNQYGSNINLWRGFYLHEATVRLKSFIEADAANPKSKTMVIQAKEFVLDDMGVSGTISATNILLTLEQGSIGTWPFSIDKVGLTFLFNNVVGGELGGKVGVPYLGNEPLPYTAQVQQGDEELLYKFSIETAEDKIFNTPFSSKLTIKKGSVFTIEKEIEGFVASTKLFGNLQIASKILNTGELKFENLVLRSTSPYFVGGDLSTDTKISSSLAYFPVTIDSIGISFKGNTGGIRLRVGVNFMDMAGFSTRVSIKVLAKLEEKKVGDKIRHHWEFDGIKILDAELKAKTSGVYFSGKVSFFDNDPVYGDGFRGTLGLSIAGFLSGIKVNAYFGSMKTFRYWHADGYMPTSQIAVFPPYVYIDGFMGGVSYRMKRAVPPSFDFSKLPTEIKTEADLFKYDPGKYIPDEGSGIAFMAGVTLIIVQEYICNGDARLEVAFNKGGGLRYIQFDTNAYFLTTTTNRERTIGEKSPKSAIYGKSITLFDNVNKVFHSNHQVYINLFGILKGGGPDNLYGESVIHIDKNNWYVYMGRPRAMNDLDVLGFARFQSYFMVGTLVEPMAPPPSEMLQVFNSIDKGIMRDEPALAYGKGFAVGARFRIGYDSGRKLRPFYIKFLAGMGADGMLRNYGTSQCMGREGTIGIHGWYVSTQMYAYMIGNIGIRAFGSNFDIIYLGAAAVLRTKFPNPTWVAGNFVAKYKILGGLIKGHMNLKFTIGDECEIISPGAEIEGVVVISDIKPDPGAEDVSVFTAPQVSFNTAMNTEFKMMDKNNKVNSYRIKLQEFIVSASGKPLKANIEWNGGNDVAILRTSEILPPQTDIKVFAKIFWERKPDNGVWSTIKNEKDQIMFETKETFFKTGTAPSFIPEENVAYSYPAKYQYNFHVNEYGTGYVKLRTGQSYLFQKTTDNINWTFVARFIDSRKNRFDVPITYDQSNAKVTFSIPSQLARQTVYSLSFIKRAEASGGIDQNLSRSEVKVNAGEGNEVTLASNSLTGTITQDAEKDIYTSAFRTSRFARFEEKWASFGRGNDIFDVARGNVAVIGKRGTIQETFDEFELLGNTSNNSQPLVQLTASNDNPWLSQDISPYLYDSYPIASDITIEWRKPLEKFGLKPVKGVRLENDLGSYKLTSEDVTDGTGSTKSGTVLVAYYLSYYCFWDYNELTNKTVAKYLNNWAQAPAGAKKLLSLNGYHDLRSGDSYPVEIVYSLPGINHVTYRNQLSIKF